MTLRALEGFVVGITADRRWEEQADLLRRRGAQILHGPCLATAYVPDDEALKAVTAELIARPPQFLAATTGVGMRAWVDAARGWGLGDALVEALGRARVVARGPKAAGAVKSAGLEVWRTADNEQMDAVVAALLSEPLAGTRVALQLYGMEAPEVVESLADAGAEVVEVRVYQWRLPDDPRPALELAAAAVEGRLDAVTFTAAPAALNLFELAAREGLADELRAAFNQGGVVAACVGPVCGAGARRAGIEAPLEPPAGRLGVLIRALSDRLGQRATTLSVAGVDVVRQGRVAVVGGERVDLDAETGAALDRLEGAAGSAGGAVGDTVDESDLLARLRSRVAAASSSPPR